MTNPNEPTKEELQRANDIGGHDVSGTDSKRLTPNEEVIRNAIIETNRQQKEMVDEYELKNKYEEVIKDFERLGFNNLGNKAVSDKILKFILQALQKRDEVKDKEWRERIEKLFENEGDIDFIKNQLLNQ